MFDLLLSFDKGDTGSIYSQCYMTKVDLRLADEHYYKESAVLVLTLTVYVNITKAI